jgi:hypothetical protein
MKLFFNRFISFIKDSCLSQDKSKISSTRVSSYFILGGILTNMSIFMIIDIVNAAIHWKVNKAYEIPVSHISIWGMVLAHHLVLLGFKKPEQKKE